MPQYPYFSASAKMVVPSLLHFMTISFVLATLILWNNNFHHHRHQDSGGAIKTNHGNGSSFYSSTTTFGISTANAFPLISSPRRSLGSKKYIDASSFQSFSSSSHVRSYGAIAPLYQTRQTTTGGSSSGNDNASSRSRRSPTWSSGRIANKNNVSDAQLTNNARGDATGSSDRTEVSRLKFVINQLKGNMQESEMRASAAENRVAMLQQQMKEMEGNKTKFNLKEENDKEWTKTNQGNAIQQGDVDKLKQEHENETKSLKEQITMLKMSWEAFRDKSEKQMKDVEQQHADEMKEWESKYNDLQIELGMAKKELVESKEKVANLRKEIQALELEMANRLNELKGQLVAEIKEVATKKDNEISVIKVEAENMRNTLLKEYEILEEKLIESQKGSKALMKDLERAKMELTSELISFKERTQKELNVMQQRLKEKEIDLIATKKELDEMQAERQSLRKLLKVQGSLILDRLAKRFGRKKNKLK